MTEYGKIPPQEIEIEQNVLACCMIDQDALNTAIEIINTETFYKDINRTIFKSIISLYGSGEPVDMVSVVNELKRGGNLESIGGIANLSELTRSANVSANIDYQCRIIQQQYLKRELIRISSEVSKGAYDDTSDVFDLLEKIQVEIFNISGDNFKRDYRDISDVGLEAMEKIKAASESDNDITGIPSGLVDVDRLTSGWQPTDLIIHAARPGMGKTAFLIQNARNIAIKFNRPVGIFSLEMGATQLFNRILSGETNINQSKFRNGDLSQAEFTTMNVKLNSILNSNIKIDDTPAITPFELRSKARKMVLKDKVEIIFIDYIQLMEFKGGESREQKVSSISRALKALAKELNIPVVCLSQLNRSVETRTDKTPLLSDLRESGAIEQDADIVMFLYRPEYYTKDPLDANVTDLIFAKHRNGSLQTVSVNSNMATGNYTDQTNIIQDIPTDEPIF